MKVVVHSSSLWFLVVSIVFGLPVSRVRRNPDKNEAEPGTPQRMGPASAVTGSGGEPKPNLTRYHKRA